MRLGIRPIMMERIAFVTFTMCCMSPLRAKRSLALGGWTVLVLLRTAIDKVDRTGRAHTQCSVQDTAFAKAGRARAGTCVLKMGDYADFRALAL